MDCCAGTNGQGASLLRMPGREGADTGFGPDRGGEWAVLEVLGTVSSADKEGVSSSKPDVPPACGTIAPVGQANAHVTSAASRHVYRFAVCQRHDERPGPAGGPQIGSIDTGRLRRVGCLEGPQTQQNTAKHLPARCWRTCSQWNPLPHWRRRTETPSLRGRITT